MEVGKAIGKTNANMRISGVMGMVTSSIDRGRRRHNLRVAQQIGSEFIAKETKIAYMYYLWSASTTSSGISVGHTTFGIPPMLLETARPCMVANIEVGSIKQKYCKGIILLRQEIGERKNYEETCISIGSHCFFTDPSDTIVCCSKNCASASFHMGC